MSCASRSEVAAPDRQVSLSVRRIPAQVRQLVAHSISEDERLKCENGYAWLQSRLNKMPV
jgi:hypothetical protein